MFRGASKPSIFPYYSMIYNQSATVVTRGYEVTAVV